MLLWLSIAAATLVATAVVVWPLLSSRAPLQADARDDERRRVAVFRDRKSEIERERAAGRLSDADAEQAQADLLRQVADDLPEAAAASGGSVPGATAAVGSAAATAARGTAAAPGRTVTLVALALALLVPLIAVSVYHRVGAPDLASLDLRAGHPPVGAGDIDQLIAGIEQRTRERPDDGEAWAMLAEARRIQGRHAEALVAFEQAVRRMPSDARLLADYAETAAVLAKGDFSGLPTELLGRALAANPDEPKAIALMGAAQYRLGNLEAARGYLKKLHASLPAGSDDAAQIGEVLARIESELAHRGAAPSTGSSPAAAGGTGKPPAAVAEAASSVSGTVAIDASLADRVRPGDTLYVIARQAGGPPVPIAAVRQANARLPMPFSIGDADAMDPSRRLASADSLVLEARLSRSGNAMRQPGDLYGQRAGVAPGQRDVTIVIDRVVTP
ncbi:MAG: c-type cytochrome biogenesis protein CcmI [Burkholderiaceae bacterium]|nr:c-type cytochrome biogenesis protein CcmI [Burkholderiaceae bacterium]MEB2352353.1 c-type cytochrome biogenesis protein CcmI [Burkholderiaceae bacterium]